ncbi:signaling lymphocytic activation molecule-like isoform X2 [Clupea harengus]|uniref:Signaling lymphocytic activation molecule-like isoform X2 n=1 Tax=Clupea harengus TaxID=7950 RepID=A0A6P8EUJ5_CLUHA|nr:signaling lymphocytic activation molecule-like isoform X2 [Clupea harengus]
MWICWKTYLLVIFCGEFCSSENHITPKKQEVSGLQGEYIMFPVPVSQYGGMRTEGGETLATVFGGQVRVEDMPRFKSRLRWDSQTGHFSLHNLTVADSGSYVIESTEGLEGKYTFRLTVYEQLSSPKVTLHDKSSCTWTCSVENGRNVSLSWYAENMLLNQTRNPHINTNLSLHLTSENSASYNCVAANPIMNVTFQLSSDHLQERCLASSSADPERHILYISVLCVVCIIAVVGVFLCLRKMTNHIEVSTIYK